MNSNHPPYPKEDIVSRYSNTEKAVSFAGALASKYLTTWGMARKASAATKEVRRLSCNGDGGDLPPCEHRRPSQVFPGSYFCGACGCGDRQKVLVSGDTPEYEKLDFPYLRCPIRMPGFANFTPSYTDPTGGARKVQLEAMLGVGTLVDLVEKQRRGRRMQRRWRHLRNLVWPGKRTAAVIDEAPEA